jgi:hypothetical protein
MGRGIAGVFAGALALVMAGPALASAPTGYIPDGAIKIVEKGNVTEYDVPADPQAVAAFYHKLLPNDGWSVTSDVVSPTAISFFFSRGATGDGSVVIRVRGDVSHVVLTLTE